MNSFISVGERMGIDEMRVKSIIHNLIEDFPTTCDNDDVYSVYSDSDPEGTAYFFELKDQGSRDLSTLELMKISTGRFIVLSSSERGLLYGDIINVTNTIFMHGSSIRAIIENDSECENFIYTSLPINAIRRKVPSLVHQVISAPDFTMNLDSEFEFEELKDMEFLDATIPVMGILMGRFSKKASTYISIESGNVTKAKTKENQKLKTTSKFGMWTKV